MSADVHETLAHAYLKQQFGPQGYAGLAVLGGFDEQPLEGEGAVTVFTFTTRRPGTLPEHCFVVAGQTEPNYYPFLNLSAEDCYNLHVGTRFMLVLEIAQLSEDAPVGDLNALAATALAGVVPGQPVTDVKLAAAFKLDDQSHIVVRASVGAEEVYLVLGDLPLGVYRHIQLPPHVIYRMHLGQVIRLEKADEYD